MVSGLVESLREFISMSRRHINGSGRYEIVRIGDEFDVVPQRIGRDKSPRILPGFFFRSLFVSPRRFEPDPDQNIGLAVMAFDHGDGCAYILFEPIDIGAVLQPEGRIGVSQAAEGVAIAVWHLRLHHRHGSTSRAFFRLANREAAKT
jgi:hypothetical protein